MIVGLVWSKLKLVAALAKNEQWYSAFVNTKRTLIFPKCLECRQLWQVVNELDVSSGEIQRPPQQSVDGEPENEHKDTKQNLLGDL